MTNAGVVEQQHFHVGHRCGPWYHHFQSRKHGKCKDLRSPSRKAATIATGKTTCICLRRNAETGLLLNSMFLTGLAVFLSYSPSNTVEHGDILEHFETILSFGGTASTTRAQILKISRASSGPCTPRWRLRNSEDWLK